MGESLGKADQVGSLIRFVVLKESCAVTIERFGIDPDDDLGLNKDDVFSSPISDFGVQGMIKIDDLIKMIEGWAVKHTRAGESVWFSEEGRECELLLTKGGGWQKGRFRFRLEFIPDKPEIFESKSSENTLLNKSPLDDLRSNLEV